MNKRRNQYVHGNYSYCIKAGITSQKSSAINAKNATRSSLGTILNNAYHKVANHNI